MEKFSVVVVGFSANGVTDLVGTAKQEDGAGDVQDCLKNPHKRPERSG
jgi:hypothetical protein